ncbi:shikimate dehydrogenase [Bifidobacterium sp. ESL0790]|uniref:shikimate dehydrogenase family protein n=1 Tax=Bifidobacterium sp. ESL0790 TaxID=2983233 RepID=UPI0023F99E79|nr:shikimate dehydrogenase [Bifidobacterium sp. ESL0790]WEV71688.1 shikimate dehydrogenase [Bifidobacterium sp. ESL0790]
MTSPTHQCAVLGKPIAHSLSPVLHNAAYEFLGLPNWSYTRAEVGKDDLAGFLEQLDSTWSGLSLTMPLKRTIIPYGPTCDKWSSTLQVANTAVFDWSSAGEGAKPGIRLYNTDVDGIRHAFGHAFDQQRSDSKQTGGSEEKTTHARHRRKGFKAVILGNGNTALSALAAFTELQMPGLGGLSSVTVCARNESKNTALQELAGKYADRFSFETAPLTEAWSYLPEADVAVNTIPGLGADDAAQKLEDALRGSGAHISGTLLDVVYDPRPTKLMKTWNAFGGTIIGGEEMLLYQAIDQVLLMTGIRAPGEPYDANSSQKNQRITASTGAHSLFAAGTAESSMADRWKTDTAGSFKGLEQAMRTALREAL